MTLVPGHPGHREIIEGLRRGDEQSVRTLYAMYYRPLCYFAERMIYNKPEAEDIAVETFLKLLNKRNDFDNLADIKSFLFTAARNACIDFFRKQKRRQQSGRGLEMVTVPEESFGEAEMIIARLLQTIYAEIENLPGQCKKVFKSFFIEGKTTAVIAEEMGISPQTVLNQKIKALHSLRLTLLKEGLQFTGSVTYLLFLLRSMY
jgi:RNA polymerase sigma-70 factor (family 1)